MAMEGSWSQQGLNPDNSYKYNGKELDQDFGLDWYHYGARMYDAQIGRFTSVDPAADLYSPVSPYVYTINNPLKYTDPNGMWIVGEDGERVTYSEKDGWSDNASEDVRQIGNAMLGFEQGQIDLNDMLNHETKINLAVETQGAIKLQNGKEYPLLGLTQPHDANGQPLNVVADLDSEVFGDTKFDGTPAYIENEDGTSNYMEVTLTVYEKNIANDVVNNKRNFDYNNLTPSQGIGVTAGHEQVHGINTANITGHRSKLDCNYKYDVEIPAYKHEQLYYKQIKGN